MLFQKKVRKSEKKNEKAFEDLIHKEKEKLYRMAFLYVRNEDDAIDIVQETIYKAFTSLEKLKEPKYFSTWITRILINTALDFIRKNSHIIPFENIEQIQSAENRLTDYQIDLVDAVKRLDEPYKTVVILRYYKDFTVKQIAETVNCPEGTVKSNLHRAVGKLKLDLKEGYGP